MDFLDNSILENNGTTTFHNNQSTHNYNGMPKVTHGDTTNRTHDPSKGPPVKNSDIPNSYAQGYPSNWGPTNGNHYANGVPPPAACSGVPPIHGMQPYGLNPPFYPPPGCVYPPGPWEPFGGSGPQQFPPVPPEIPGAPPYVFRGQKQPPLDFPPDRHQSPIQQAQASAVPSTSSSGKGVPGS